MQDEYIDTTSFNSENNDNDIKGPPKACIFVASLTNFTTEEDLRELFNEYGEILKIKLLKDHVSRPYAFIQFSSEDDASNAIQSTKNTILNNRRLRVERARVNRTLFVAKFSKQMQASQLQDIMGEYGEVESVTIIKNHQTNRSKGCGFVKFAFREDAAQALADLKGPQQKWVVEWATSNNDPENLRVDKNNIFIGGLNTDEISEELLREHFGGYGEIESLTLVNRGETESQENDGSVPKSSPSPTPTTTSASSDPNEIRQRNAFAFIRYKEEENATSAIEAENGTVWLDKRIRVQYCESKEMKNRRRAKNMKYSPYGPAPYYPGMPMIYMPDDMGTNMYNSYYPMYYNGGAPWMPYPQMAMDGQMMQNAMYGEDMSGVAFAQMNMSPAVVPVLPWLP